MAGKNTSVFGIYTSYANVENAVDALKAAGFSNRDIIMPRRIRGQIAIMQPS